MFGQRLTPRPNDGIFVFKDSHSATYALPFLLLQKKRLNNPKFLYNFTSFSIELINDVRCKMHASNPVHVGRTVKANSNHLN